MTQQSTQAFICVFLRRIVQVFKNTLFHICKICNKNYQLVILTILIVLVLTLDKWLKWPIFREILFTIRFTIRYLSNFSIKVCVHQRVKHVFLFHTSFTLWSSMLLVLKTHDLFEIIQCLECTLQVTASKFQLLNSE